MKVTFFAQPDLKDFLPDAAHPFFEREMVAGGFKVQVVYEPAPNNPNVWHDGTTFFQTPGKPRLRPISLLSTLTISFKFRADRCQLRARCSQRTAERVRGSLCDRDDAS
jgi:hypothetical protein